MIGKAPQANLKAGLRVREYSGSGPTVIVLHGGPGAAGSAGGLAAPLSPDWHVLEPWQRRSGQGAVTVRRHIQDLHRLIVEHCPGERPALIGESWGAMLALSYAAENPGTVCGLALVGCGTFTIQARERLRRTLKERTSPELRDELSALERAGLGAPQRLERLYELTRPLYDYEVSEERDVARPPVDIAGHTETWEDMMRLQREGRYPAAFRTIAVPVLMLHGAHDPHPGELIRDSLVPFMPQLRYMEWQRCGHSPWRETHVRGRFFQTLKTWLAETV